ncbi:MAG: FecR domain-containing protein, partial [Solimonas sp.]
MAADDREPPAPPDDAGDEARAEQALQRHRDALRERFPLPDADALAPRPRRLPKKTVLGALAVLLAAGALWSADPAYRREHYETAVGARQAVALADGSTLTLNTGTRLDVSWHLRSRRVALLRGEALFDVAHER